LLVAACSGSGGPGVHVDRNDLDSMDTARITIDGHTFEVWVADEPLERELGLMHVEAAELAPTADGATRGMLFVFGSDQLLGFWMKDTPTPLDIAFLQTDGKIVRIATMEPFDTSSTLSGRPARFALEVLAGTYGSLGIDVGDSGNLPQF
jgi:hypothetical protein